MVKLIGINFVNNAGEEVTFDIPEEKRMTFESYCATVNEEVACAGGMLLGVFFENQEHEQNIPKDMCMIFEYKLGIIKKKITLADGGNEKKEIIRMSELIFKAEEEMEFFDVPPKMKILFGKVAQTEQEVADSAGNLFIKSVSDD